MDQVSGLNSKEHHLTNLTSFETIHFAQIKTQKVVVKRCRSEIPVSMVPPKKRALKARDNEVDLNIRLGTNHYDLLLKE